MKNLMLLVFCLLSLMSCNTQPDKIYIETSPTIDGTFGIEDGKKLILYKDGSYIVGRSSSTESPILLDFEMVESGIYTIKVDKIILYNEEANLIPNIVLPNGDTIPDPFFKGPSYMLIFTPAFTELSLCDITNNEIK